MEGSKTREIFLCLNTRPNNSSWTSGDWFNEEQATSTIAQMLVIQETPLVYAKEGKRKTHKNKNGEHVLAFGASLILDSTNTN